MSTYLFPEHQFSPSYFYLLCYFQYCTILTKCSGYASQMILNWRLMVLSQITPASKISILNDIFSAPSAFWTKMTFGRWKVSPKFALMKKICAAPRSIFCSSTQCQPNKWLISLNRQLCHTYHTQISLTHIKKSLNTSSFYEHFHSHHTQ